MAESRFRERLAKPRPVLLDGAVGTELARRGIPTVLPLWSAHALWDDAGLQLLSGIHEEYARAGAEILVTNTFRTTQRTLTKAGRSSDWALVNQQAVQCARSAVNSAVQPCWVAGGIAPLEDCYRSDLVPAQEDCLREHSRQVELLAKLGVDLIFIETMNCLREALAALTAARDTGLDVLLSFCPLAPDHLLSREPLEKVLPQVLEAGGSALRGVLLNCAPPEVLGGMYPRFASRLSGFPHGVYGHLGEPDEIIGWKLPADHNPQAYAEWVAARLKEGARLVGGCCGTTPAHIAELARLLHAGSFDNV